MKAIFKKMLTDKSSRHGVAFSALAIWIYNLVAERIGGIEFELSEVEGT